MANCHSELSLTCETRMDGLDPCDDEDEFVDIIEYNGKKHNIKASWLGRPAYLILAGSGSLR